MAFDRSFHLSFQFFMRLSPLFSVCMFLLRQLFMCSLQIFCQTLAIVYFSRNANYIMLQKHRRANNQWAFNNSILKIEISNGCFGFVLSNFDHTNKQLIKDYILFKIKKKICAALQNIRISKIVFNFCRQFCRQ